MQRKLEELTGKLRGQPGLTHILPATDPALRDQIWACRKAALPLLMGMPGLRKPIAFVEDTAVDPAKLPEFVRRFREILHAEGTDGAFYGHASVGCLHIRPMIDSSNKDDLDRMRRILDEVSDLVLEFGGAMSGEHGDGLARSFLEREAVRPAALSGVQGSEGRLRPARAAEPRQGRRWPQSRREPAAAARLSARSRSPTTLDFSRQGGFARSVELCNGAGVCRKTRTGTMCPRSWSRGDEEHSTRGRANALRLVLSGVLPPEELTGQRLYQTFDLCLQCKAARRSAPRTSTWPS